MGDGEIPYRLVRFGGSYGAGQDVMFVVLEDARYDSLYTAKMTSFKMRFVS